MRQGDELLLRGPAGALFRVTVGTVFTEADIERRLASGEWRYPDDPPAPATATDEAPAGEDRPEALAPVTPAPPVDPSRPAQSAPKSAWIDHVVRARLLSREDAENYTKADLIEIAS